MEVATGTDGGGHPLLPPPSSSSSSSSSLGDYEVNSPVVAVQEEDMEH